MQETRQRVLQALWNDSALSVEELATRLGLSPMTLRHHLGVLEREGLVCATTASCAGRSGRPRLLFRLTPAGAEAFPSNALQLAGWLADALKAELGCATFEALLRRIAERVASEFVPPARNSLTRRLDQMVTFLNNKGYQAGWKAEQRPASAYLFWIGACPYRWLVQQHPEICRLDQTLLARLSGGAVERVAVDEPAGQPTCVYRLFWPLANAPTTQDNYPWLAPQQADHKGG